MLNPLKLLKRLCWMLLFATAGCFDEAAIVLPFGEPRLVVDALLSDTKKFSHIQIGWSYPSGINCSDPYAMADRCKADTSAIDARVTGKVTITGEDGLKYEYNFRMADRNGYLDLPVGADMTGTAGKKYDLYIEVTYNGATTIYHAQTAMQPTPDITAISYEIRKGAVGKSDDMVPLISFHEPQNEKNWYLFQLCHNSAANAPSGCTGHSAVWSASVLTDTFLPEDIVDLSVDNGATLVKYASFYPDAYPGASVGVQMYSIDKPTYQFYKTVLEQFDNDGGVYTSSPATPPGNISNGALGIFRATQLKYAQITY